MNTGMLTKGVERIWNEDAKSQEQYLQMFHEVVRKMDNIQSLVEAKAFFVPNASYLIEYFGPEIKDSSLGLYDWEGYCRWQNFMMFPVYNLSRDVAGFAGYDIYSKAKEKSGEEIEISNFYRYQPSYVFPRGRYLYAIPGVFEKAMQDKYICVVDGFYDVYSLHAEKINVCSTLGSTVTEHLVFALSFIENIYVLEDNDDAGLWLYNELSRRLPNVFYIKQGKTKDADDILKSSYKDAYLNTLRETIRLRTSKTLRYSTLG